MRDRASHAVMVVRSMEHSMIGVARVRYANRVMIKALVAKIP